MQEGEADFIAVAPLHACRHRPLLVRNVELDHIRNVHGVGKDDARTLILAAAVEMDTTAQKTLLTYLTDDPFTTGQQRA